MADDVEIRAATLPGFPYYFPYRTGVRLQATPVAEAHYIRDGQTGVTTVAGVEAEAQRGTFSPGSLTQVTAAITAGAQATVVSGASLVLTADVEATPPGLEGSLLIARATLDVQVLPDYPEVHREAYAEADLAAALATLPTLELNRTLTALLAVRVGLSATMLYNRENGNPLWLMFFYAGRGLYPVPDSGSAEE